MAAIRRCHGSTGSENGIALMINEQFIERLSAIISVEDDGVSAVAQTAQIMSITTYRLLEAIEDGYFDNDKMVAALRHIPEAVIFLLAIMLSFSRTPINTEMETQLSKYEAELSLKNCDSNSDEE